MLADVRLFFAFLLAQLDSIGFLLYPVMNDVGEMPFGTTNILNIISSFGCNPHSRKCYSVPAEQATAQNVCIGCVLVLFAGKELENTCIMIVSR